MSVKRFLPRRQNTPRNIGFIGLAEVVVTVNVAATLANTDIVNALSDESQLFRIAMDKISREEEQTIDIRWRTTADSHGLLVTDS